jgi:hypothetical protein
MEFLLSWKHCGLSFAKHVMPLQDKKLKFRTIFCYSGYCTNQTEISETLPETFKTKLATLITYLQTFDNYLKLSKFEGLSCSKINTSKNILYTTPDLLTGSFKSISSRPTSLLRFTFHFVFQWSLFLLLHTNT